MHNIQVLHILLDILKSTEISREFQNEEGNIELIEDNMIRGEEREKLKEKLIERAKQL